MIGSHLSGFMQDGAHVLPIRVYYEDTDFSARVYHASYLRFMERGRTELLRAVEVAQSDLHAEMDGLAFVVRKMNIDFRGGAVMDDVLDHRHPAEGDARRVDDAGPGGPARRRGAGRRRCHGRRRQGRAGRADSGRAAGGADDGCTLGLTLPCRARRALDRKAAALEPRRQSGSSIALQRSCTGLLKLESHQPNYYGHPESGEEPTDARLR